MDEMNAFQIKSIIATIDLIKDQIDEWITECDKATCVAEYHLYNANFCNANEHLWNEIELRVRNAINMAIVDKCEATGSYAKEKPDANQD